MFDSPDLKVGAFLASWLHDSVKGSVKPITHDSYQRLVNKHIIPAIGNVKRSKLSPAHLQGC